MKKIIAFLIGFLYFTSLYILKEAFFTPKLTPLINTYISLEKIYYISFVFAIIFIMSSLIDGVFKKLEKKENKKSVSKHILPILKKIIKIGIWLFGAIGIISNLGYNVGALLTGAGIGGLALALASQKTVANIFGAVNVLLNKPFEIGDHIKIGNFEGTVDDIRLIYLKIISPNGHQIMIPNETITSSAIENLSKTK